MSNPELSGELPQATAVDVFRPNGAHVIFSQFSANVFGSGPRSWWRNPITFLLQHIAHVFALCAEEQVIRSNAQRIVAMMANALTEGNRAVGQHPRQAVAYPHAPKKPLLTIAIGICGARPQPTGWGFLDSIPEFADIYLYHAVEYTTTRSNYAVGI